jgi:rubrerythrin
MDKNFVELTQKMVKERGKDILNNTRLTKALLMDYSHGEYKNEINLFIKTIELGYPQKIMKTDDVNIVKLILSKELTEEHFIVEKMSFSIISLLISLIKDIKYNDETKEENINDFIDKNIEQKKNNSIKSNSYTLKPNNILQLGWVEKIIQETRICKICGKTVERKYTACPHCGALNYK